MSSNVAAQKGTRGIPPVAISQTSTLVTRTGSWKSIRPEYHDRVAPCNAACPVGIDIEGYMNLLREDRIDEARELLLAENPMPAVTGRVCHHPCENACNRRTFDGAVSIHAVERMLGAFAVEREPHVAPAARHEERVAVVGSGPAGLACAYHLARFGYRVTVFESAPHAGGMLRLGIPAYRLPRAALDRDIARIKAQGVTIRCGTRVGDSPRWSTLLSMYDAVCIATGAHTSRALGVEGESLPGVQPGLAFLREINAGARPNLGRNVVVVGGGNTAMDCARSALRLGAAVTVVYRRTRDEMPAIDEEVDEAQREGAQLRFLANPVAFAQADGRVSGVVCERMELGEADASGRRRPMPTGERFTVEADTVLTAIGESSEFADFPEVVTRAESGVPVNAVGQTNRATVFAGGDVTDLARTVADALGAGKRAAIGIDRHLRAGAGGGHDGRDPDALRFAGGNISAVRWMGRDPIARVAPLNEVVGLDDLNFHHFAAAPGHLDSHVTGGATHTAFDEVNDGLTPEEAIAEARRCLNCGVCTQCDLCLIFCPDAAITRDADGAYEIALDYCKGCGICVAECPRGAMTMTQDRP